MKRHWKYLLLGALIGVGLVAVQRALNLDQGIVTGITCFAAVLVIVGSLIYNYIFIRPFRDRVRNQIDLLEAEKPAEALSDMKEMYQELENRGMKRIARTCRLNMTAAYCDLEEYDAALRIIHELKDEEFGPVEKMVYYLNACACLFYQGREEAALQYYKKGEKMFQQFSGDQMYGGNIAVITMYAMMAEGKWEEASKLLETAREKWDKNTLRKDYDRIDKKLRNGDRHH